MRITSPHFAIVGDNAELLGYEGMKGRLLDSVLRWCPDRIIESIALIFT